MVQWNKPRDGRARGEREGEWVVKGHLDAAQGKASSHSNLHIFILKLVQEAQESLGKSRKADLVRQ